MRFGALRGAGIALALMVAGGTAFAQSAGPKAYIGLFKDNAIAVVDTASNRLLATIAIPPGPHGLVITPDGRTVFASSDGDSRVSVIDASTDTVRAFIEVGKSPHGLAITPDGRIVLAAVFGESQVVFIDAASRKILGRVPVPSPHNIAVTPDGRTAYVAAQAKGALGLVVLDVPGMRQLGVVRLDKTPRALSVSPDGRRVYFTLGGSDSVQVLDAASATILHQVPVGASPHHPLQDPSRNDALVVSQGPGLLEVINEDGDTVTGNVKVGTLPHWIALTPDQKAAYVTNEGSNDVTVVDLDTLAVTATIPVGNAPRKIVIQPGSGSSGSAAPAGTASAAVVQVAISGFSFPDETRVRTGQTVTWTNQDSVPHSVTSDTGLWDSGDIAPGGSFSRRFDLAGTFSYHCGIHPSMQASVIVTGGM